VEGQLNAATRKLAGEVGCGMLSRMALVSEWRVRRVIYQECITTGFPGRTRPAPR
jgi:hypothetical protein